MISADVDARHTTRASARLKPLLYEDIDLDVILTNRSISIFAIHMQH